MHTFQLRIKRPKREDQEVEQGRIWNIQKKQEILQIKMKHIQQQIIKKGRSEELVEEEELLINKLEERRQQEEILWKQESRIQWLKEGEINTKFFHKAMIQHRQQNRIFSLMDQQHNRLTLYNFLYK